MRKIDPDTALAVLAILGVVALFVGVPEAFNEGVEIPLAQADKALGLPTATPKAGSVTRPTPVMMPGVAPAETAPSGRHILGGKCSVPYERSDQDPNLICSVDCGMTWRSESHPGVCY